jgi:hypothetical protein
MSAESVFGTRFAKRGVYEKLVSSAREKKEIQINFKKGPQPRRYKRTSVGGIWGRRMLSRTGTKGFVSYG